MGGEACLTVASRIQGRNRRARDTARRLPIHFAEGRSQKSIRIAPDAIGVAFALLLLATFGLQSSESGAATNPGATTTWVLKRDTSMVAKSESGSPPSLQKPASKLPLRRFLGPMAIVVQGHSFRTLW